MMPLVFTFKDEIVLFIGTCIFKKNKFKTISSLKTHDVFHTCLRVKKEIQNMSFKTDGEFDRTKTLMCSDLAKAKTEVCSDRINTLLDDEMIKIDPQAMKQAIFKEQILMHEVYIDIIKKDWALRGIPAEDIEYVVYMFEKHRADVIESFENRINSIFGSEYHRDNYDRMLAILEMWSMGIDLLPKDMKTTFEALNGRFKHIKY